MDSSDDNGRRIHQAAATEIAAAEPPTADQETPVQPVASAAGRTVEAWVPHVAQADVAPENTAELIEEEDPEPGRPLWKRESIWFGALAFIAGAAGEVLLFQPELRGRGAVLHIVAAILAVAAWRGMRERPILTPRPDRSERRISWSAGAKLRLAGIAGSLALWVVSLWAYFTSPDEIFGLQGWFWLGAMLLFIVSCLRWHPRPQSDSESVAEADLGPRWTRNEALILGGIVALSFLLRVPWLSEIPWEISEDTFLNWRETQAFMTYPPRISIFTTTYMGLGQPSLWFAVPALSMKVFGENLVGMRLPVAVLGSLLVLPVYGIARLSWGKTAAGVAAFAVAVSASMIHWSRAAIGDMATCLWWTAAFYFLLRGLRSRRPADFMWAGLICGTSQYTHYASRMLPFVLAVFFGYLAIFHFRALVSRLGHIALVAAGFLIGAGPINAYFLLHPEQWGSRASSAFLIPVAIPTTWDEVVHVWNIVAQQLQQNYLMFSVIPTRDRFYHASMLLPWEGVLLVLGTAWLVWRWKQPAAFLMLLWGGSLLLLNSVIEVQANPNPNLTHFRPAWSAYYLALAIPPALFLASLRRAGRTAWKVGATLLGIGAIWLLASNIYFYLYTYPQMVSVGSSFRTVQDRLFLNAKTTEVVRVVGGGWYLYDRTSGNLQAPQTPAGLWFNQSRQLPLVGGTSYDQVFAYIPGDPYESIIKYYYPEGQVVPLPRADGQEGVRTYRVSAQQMQAQYGVTARFTRAGGENAPLWEGKLPSIGDLPHQANLTYPVTGMWSGYLYVPTAGEIRVQLSGAPDAQVWLPGQASANGPTTLDSGWVPFVAQAELTEPAQVQVSLQLNGGSPSPVDRLHLWPYSPDNGLAVTVTGTNLPGPVHRIDPFVGSTLLWPIGNDRDIHQPGSLDPAEAFQIFNGPGLLGPQAVEGGAIRWEGELYSEGGQHGMNVYTGADWQVRLTLDGTSVFSQCLGPDGNHAGQVTLSEGWHHVQLDVMGGTIQRGVQWTWTRPDGVTEIVPPWRLRYAPTIGPGTSISWPSAPEPLNCQP
ncbi:MAG TPA: glycosyltransferase family 39 protein [Chloroflexia bacterium]